MTDQSKGCCTASADATDSAAAAAAQPDGFEFDVREEQFAGPWSHVCSVYHAMPSTPSYNSRSQNHFYDLHATIIGTMAVADLLVAHGNALQIAKDNDTDKVVVGFDPGNLKCAYHVLRQHLSRLEEEMRESREFWLNTRTWLNEWHAQGAPQ